MAFIAKGSEPHLRLTIKSQVPKEESCVKRDGLKKAWQNRHSIERVRADERLSGRKAIRFSEFLQSKNKPHQFLGGMRDSNVVMLALGSFFSEV